MMKVSQDAMRLVCPRCGNDDVLVTSKDKIKGATVNINYGIKYIRYVCYKCSLIFEVAD